MAIEHEIDSPFALAVRAIGSQSAMARLIGKGQATVYTRLKNGKPIWDDRELIEKIVVATGIPKERLRPDLFGPEPAAAVLPGRMEATR